MCGVAAGLVKRCGVDVSRLQSIVDAEKELAGDHDGPGDTTLPTPVIGGSRKPLGQDITTALVDYYRQRWQAESGQTLDRTEFAELFDYAALQRCLKATGTFAAMHGLYQRSQYLPYIAPTLRIVKARLKRYAALQPLARCLQHMIPSW